MTDMTTVLARTQTLILAGGQGERLSPLTIPRPKPAVPFGGTFRIIDFTLSNCLNSEVSRVALLTQYRHEQLRTYIRHGWTGIWNGTRSGRAPLLCLPPTTGKRYRGTADAVFQNIFVWESEKPEFVLILSGDHIYNMDYRDLLRRHVRTGAGVTVATVEHPLKDAVNFGVVEVDAAFRVIGFQEKPATPRPMPGRPGLALVSMGVYVFNWEVLKQTLVDHCDARRGYDFGHNVIPSLIGSGRVHAYDFRDEARDRPRYWRDIGTLDAYYLASMDFVRAGHDCTPNVNRSPSFQSVTQMNARSCISAGARALGSVVSSGVRIEKGASVEDSVLMPGVRIGRGARIRRAIVEEGVHIPDGLHVGFELQRDRQRYLVTDADVVVVSEVSEPRQAPVSLERVAIFSACGRKQPVNRAIA